MRFFLIPCVALLLLSCSTKSSAQPPDDSGSDQPVVYSTLFSPGRAWQHLETQLDYGPRVTGMSGHTECRKYIEQHLLATCDKVEQQEFTYDHPQDGKLDFCNIIGRFNLEAKRRIILAAHWDTRPRADYNPPGHRDEPIPGANDGASGVAVLLELATVFHTLKPEVGVDLVFFDGEDYGPLLEHMLLGSKYFAEQLDQDQADAYNWGVLIDMIGDKELDIRPENNSEGRASAVFTVAYEVSRALGYRCFKLTGQLDIEDDHLALIERGIRMYDFIDFAYPNLPGKGESYWHTTRDTADKCSKDSLESVGRTLENMVYKFPHLYEPE